MTDGLDVTFIEGEERLEVRGESHYLDELRLIEREIGRQAPALVVPEPENSHDPNAVGVWIAGLKVGHLSAESAAKYQPAILTLINEDEMPVAFSAQLIGGQPDRPNIGVLLLHDPAELGLPSQSTGERIHAAHSERGGVLTGSAAAELTWTDELPSDRIKAIEYLREKLETEADPLERHFLFLELEESLYKCRDVFESALAEFEETCRQHDGEIEEVCSRLTSYHGGVPALPTYRQMAIMKQKAGDYEAALWWTARGLSLYSDNGPREDFVNDLRKRAAKYRRRIADG